MSKSKSTTSESSSNRSQKTNKDVTLAKALLTEKGIVRSMFDFTSISQTYRILLTCKEMLAAEEEIFEGLKLPAVCNMDECNELSLYRAMVGTPESRWLQWVDTSEVEELFLPESVTDEEMFRMFGGGRFSELQTLNLSGCSNITDPSVMEVARRCSNLQTLNLEWCTNITDASVMEVARRCSNLQTLNLTCCSNITDASVMEVARRCSNLQTLTLYGCSNITDTSVMEVARRCSNLQSLNLGGYGSRITDASVMEVARGCSNLQTLNLQFCRNITDASVMEVARRCSNLQTLNLNSVFGDSNITSACKNALRQSHPKLQLH